LLLASCANNCRVCLSNCLAMINGGHLTRLVNCQFTRRPGTLFP